MTEIISFYSPVASQGKRTLSTGFANLLAKNHNRTLFIELDLSMAAIAISNSISHEYKNVLEYFKTAYELDQFRLDRHVLTNEDLLKISRSDFKYYPDKLDFLVLPSDFEESQFPTIVSDEVKNPEQIAAEFIKKFMYELSLSQYDYVVLSLPNEINHLFAYEVLAQSNKVVNVITPSPVNLSKNKKIISELKKSIPLEDQLYTVINMASDDVDYSLYKSLTGTTKNLIISTYDSERQINEYAMKIESPTIEANLTRLAENMEILLNETTNTKIKKGFFNLG